MLWEGGRTNWQPSSQASSLTRQLFTSMGIQGVSGGAVAGRMLKMVPAVAGSRVDRHTPPSERSMTQAGVGWAWPSASEIKALT